MRTIEDVINRLRAEFLEMPGLHLKLEQVQRLCGIERTMCQMALDLLVGEKCLCVKSNGHYARLTDQAVSNRSAFRKGIVTLTLWMGTAVTLHRARRPAGPHGGRASADTSDAQQDFS